ncbi:two component transcriptional regulator, LytTR family [Fibrisoma limi BUZ 3]|uniref:Two component transcriptional regulator, LytTR family n=1 Tax=Fibrisoma limi BUZ 3 TaxID=1185876 RepID=I2GFA4_9BACT|nr:response regulator [Fibrisoma limi]CCH52579.1 two component transcriptional regulator, LytTR family [Fibrisoma limi BUZ 3]
MESNTKVNILIVEDEAILAMALSDSLEAEGYNVVGIANNGTKAVDLFERNQVDLLLCDINIKGEFDGIETVRRITNARPIPVIYLTALSDSDTLERAKQTYPAAYMTKPYNLLNLRISIDMSLHTFSTRSLPAGKVPTAAPERDTILQIDDDVFIKQGYQYVKIHFSDILILEAEDIYTTFVTTTRKYALRLPLTAVLDKLNHKRLVRVHRSYAVNISRVDVFNDHEMTIGTHIVPLGKNYKDEFMNSFRFK